MAIPYLRRDPRWEGLFEIRLKNIQAAIKAETGIEENLEDIEYKMQERRRSHNSEEPKRVRNPLRGYANS